MSLFLRVPGITFTRTLPKLERDAVIKAGETVGVYDALNTASWAKQAAPTTGEPSADKWTNLVSGSADGQFFKSIGWADGFGSGTDTEKITFLNSTAPTAPSKLLGIVWLKHINSVNQPTTGQHAILNLGQRIELRYAGGATTNVSANRFYLAGAVTANRQISTPVAGAVTQIAIYYENTTQIARAFINGVEVLSAAGFANMGTATDAYQLLQRTGIDGVYIGRFYRTVIDNCVTRTAAEIVALDYALNSGRFA